MTDTFDDKLAALQQQILRERLARARANIDAWTRAFHGATPYIGYDMLQIPNPPDVWLGTEPKPEATIIPFPLHRTRRPKGEHSFP